MTDDGAGTAPLQPAYFAPTGLEISLVREFYKDSAREGDCETIRAGNFAAARRVSGGFAAERDSVSRSGGADTNGVGLFQRIISCGVSAGHRPALRVGIGWVAVCQDPQPRCGWEFFADADSG